MILMHLTSGENKMTLKIDKKGRKLPRQIAEICEASDITFTAELISKPKHVDLSAPAPSKDKEQKANQTGPEAGKQPQNPGTGASNKTGKDNKK